MDAGKALKLRSSLCAVNVFKFLRDASTVNDGNFFNYITIGLSAGQLILVYVWAPHIFRIFIFISLMHFTHSSAAASFISLIICETQPSASAAATVLSETESRQIQPAFY